MARKAKPTTYHHGDLREALIAAGTEIVERDGLAAFTLRACARKAGVSHAAPKNHFASVEDLIAEIAARGFESFHAALEKSASAAAGQSPGARLIAMARAYVAFARAHPGVYGLMFRPGMAIRPSPHLEQAGKAAWMQLYDAVGAVTGPGRGDGHVKAAHVWSLVHGLASLVVDGKLPPVVKVEDVMASCFNSLPASLGMVG